MRKTHIAKFLGAAMALTMAFTWLSPPTEPAAPLPTARLTAPLLRAQRGSALSSTLLTPPLTTATRALDRVW